MSNARVRVGDIAVEEKLVIAPDTTEAVNRPYLGLEQVEAQTGKILSYKTNSVEGKSNTFAFDQKHVLYGKLRPYLNKVALPNRKGRCSTEIIPLRPINVDREYLAFLLRTNKIVDAVMTKKTGSRMPRADMSVLFDVEVSIPDTIEKQRQIAARLKAQLAEVDKARQAVEVQLQDAELLATRLREKLMSQLGHARRLDLGELLIGIEAGKSFQTTDLPARPNQLGVLKVSAVSWDEFAPDEAKAVDGDYEPEEKHRVKKGDLIISRANTIELVGAVVRADKDYPCRLLSDKTLRLVIDEGRIMPDYLLAILKLPEARTHIENNATGTSDSMRNISQKTIKKIPVPLIELNEQEKFVRDAQSISYQLKQVNNGIQKQKAELEFLPQKILAQAFEQ